MIDPRFFTTAPSLTVSEICDLTGAEWHQEGDTTVSIQTVADFSSTDLSGAATFLGDMKRVSDVAEAAPSLCFVSAKVLKKLQEEKLLSKTNLLVLKDPKVGWAILAEKLHQSIAETGNVDVMRGEDLNNLLINATAIIAKSAKLGKDVRLGPGCYIGPGVEIGDGTSIGANVSVTHTIMGKNCNILSGATLGEAGFGFVVHEAKQIRVPQLGFVELGDEVEIGANTTVDRGTLQNTSIGDQSKIDNLVQIAHNVVMGKGCAIAGQVGISGSCIVGDRVMMGGQVGMADHVTIGNDVAIMARSGLMHDIPDGENWGGAPAQPVRQWMREIAAVKRLGKAK